MHTKIQSALNYALRTCLKLTTSYFRFVSLYSVHSIIISENGIMVVVTEPLDLRSEMSVIITPTQVYNGRIKLDKVEIHS
jgi:hypothetical protein